jgi:hypothetical protein
VNRLGAFYEVGLLGVFERYGVFPYEIGKHYDFIQDELETCVTPNVRPFVYKIANYTQDVPVKFGSVRNSSGGKMRPR